MNPIQPISNLSSLMNGLVYLGQCSIMSYYIIDGIDIFIGVEYAIPLYQTLFLIYLDCIIQIRWRASYTYLRYIEQGRLPNILPVKKYRTPDEEEKKILKRLHDELAGYEGDDENELQSIPFNVARMFNEPPKNLFKMFYEVVFGQERGPRFGTFVRLVGKEKALSLLKTVAEPWL